jgi:anhydro-N-acetylmuramic acid kinase
MASKVTDSKEKYTVVGLMSGTSLDGLDIACCTFKKKGRSWLYNISASETIRYPESWRKKLSDAHNLPGAALIETDVAYGQFLGKASLAFIKKNNLRPDFISSHGHTVFHQPAKGFTYQIGNGNAIHAISGLPVVNDFRSLDVIRGGEGAPLVPAGDKFLFQEFDVCLNLGGIANLSMDIKKQRVAFDVCYVNMALNYLAAKAGKEYDAGGNMASEGEVDKTLLKKLTAIYNRYRKQRPSLGREMFERDIQPLLDQENISLKDRLRTVVESSAREIMDTILSHKKYPKVLMTGGGAFNSFLVTCMLELAGDEATLIIPEEEIVKFKEAMVFAFLGVLRVRDEVNCLKSVTGAATDSSAGILVGF